MTNDIMNRLEQGYWNIRRVLETANFSLVSPHILWSDLNELMETCAAFEEILDIPNRWEFIKNEKVSNE